MNDKKTLEEIVAPFYSQALVHMGLVKIPNLETEVDMKAARDAIDSIEFMLEKMKGNLSEDEDKLMKEMMTSLQMTFLEMQKKNNDGNNDKKEEQ